MVRALSFTFKQILTPLFSERLIAQRESALDYVVAEPHALNGINVELAQKRRQAGVFPTLQVCILSLSSPNELPFFQRDLLFTQESLPSPQRSPWHHKVAERQPSNEAAPIVKLRQHHSADQKAASNTREKQSLRPISTYQPGVSNAEVQQCLQHKFVEQLKNEAKCERFH